MRRRAARTGSAPTTAASTCSRCIIAGSRVSLGVGFLAALVAILIGGTVGVLSGFFGGATDTILMRFTDYMLVIPDIPLMIIAAALFGRNLVNIIVIIGIIYWTSTARLIRAQVMTVRERVYVKRAKALGAGNRRLVFKHVLPQVAPLLVANTVLMIALGIFAETFITFLGLGDPSTISWGRLIENAFTGEATINNAWWAIVPPGVCVTRRDPRLHDGRAVGRGLAQPAAPGRPPLGAAVPDAAGRAARRARSERSAAARQGRGPPRLVRRCRAAASSTPCRASPSSCTRASGWASWASPAVARRRRSSR